MQIKKITAVLAVSLAMSQTAYADGAKAPLMDADELVLATQSAAGVGFGVAEVFLLLLVAAALSTQSVAAPIIPAS